MSLWGQGMKSSLRLVLLLCAVGLIVAGLVVCRKQIVRNATQLRDYETGPWAFAILSTSGVPFLVEVRVLDSRGNPVPGADVDIRNNSGGNRGSTDVNGRANIKVAEREVLQIFVDGCLVLNRPNADKLGYPSVDRGLSVLIVKKDTPTALRPR